MYIIRSEKEARKCILSVFSTERERGKGGERGRRGGKERQRACKI